MFLRDLYTTNSSLKKNIYMEQILRIHTILNKPLSPPVCIYTQLIINTTSKFVNFYHFVNYNLVDLRDISRKLYTNMFVCHR